MRRYLVSLLRLQVIAGEEIAPSCTIEDLD